MRTDFPGKCNNYATCAVYKASKLHLSNLTGSSVEGKRFERCFRPLKEPENVTFDRHLPLNERILRIDHIQARRFSKLGGTALDIATEGILRHLRACDRMDVNPDTSAVREIIDDALNGRRVFAETADDRRAA